MKTSELTGAALDWAVAKCEAWVIGTTDDDLISFVLETSPDEMHFWPCTDWAQGGPIIEREIVTVRPVFHAERTEGGSDIYRQDGWAAHVEPKAFWVTPRPIVGPTPLVAAMRCYVTSKLGDEVEIPEQLQGETA